MKHNWQLSKVVFLISFFVSGFLVNAYSQEERYAALPLTGVSNQIAKDSSSTVEDTVFFNLSLRAIQTSYSVKDLITFKVNEFANLTIPDSFKVTIAFKVYFSKLVGSTVVLDSTSSQNLVIDYNRTRAYQNKAVFTFSGGYRSQVKISSVTSNLGTFSEYKNVLMLENEIVVTRAYNFDPNVNTIQSITGILGSLTDGDSCSTAGEYMVSWGKIRGATEYDFEWTYIDSTAITNYYKTGGGSIIDPLKIFRSNASRVTVTTENYQVPLLYDNGGILFYRVRPVQTKITGQRVEGQWSSFYSGGLGQFGFAGHERGLNWQASTSFAEEGKRKSVVQYFDGTLRNRQTVTKENNSCYTVVAETVYDYQGRPAIQVLPSPTTNRMLKYTANFNRPFSGSSYEKSIFDGDATALDNSCSSMVPGMDTVSGASRYYSSFSQFNTGLGQFIPNANFYPFTETRYTPDNSGRIAMQSGVGKEFAINNTAADSYSHETKYFYGSADQEELDALFGTEVGNASHYAKNMVKDANGQYSVSYVDMHGRTIATALAGKPLVAKLDSLASSNYKLITKKLIDSTNNLVVGTSVVASKNLIVTRAGNHQFKYSLAADSASIKACDGNFVCYDCIYDLEITITNDCPNPSILPIVIRRKNYTVADSIKILCNTIPAFPSVDTTISLSEGSYTITKILSVNQPALKRYIDTFTSRNTCLSLQRIIDSVKNAFISSVQCVPSCQSCMDSLGTQESFRAKYMLNNNIAVSDSASFREQALLAYQAQLAQCNELCGSNGLHSSIRQQMLNDMTPPMGQYAEPDSFNVFLNIFYSANNSTNYRYKQYKELVPASAFKNDFGKTDSIFNNNGQKVPVTDPSITESDFLNNWKPTWAEALLPLHPEYCKLVTMESFASSYNWDERFQKIETFKQAVDSGFLNPVAFPQSASPSQSSKLLPNTATFNAPLSNARDPLFTTLATGYANDFKDSLFNYMRTTPTNIDAWSVATIMGHCSGDVNCVNLWKNINTAFTLDTSCGGELDFAWRYFKEIYLQKKTEILDRIFSNLQCTDGNAIQPWNNLNFNPIKYGDANTGIPSDSSSGVDSLNQLITDNCTAYVTQWMDEMKPCNLTSNDSSALIPRLIAVCKAGGDGSHVFGSNTTKPGTTSAVYQDSSFIQVLRSVLGARYDSTCNAFLITAPLPYKMQPSYGDIPVYTKPDSCQCSKINGYYTQYQRSVIDTSFTSFIYRKTGAVMSSNVLDSLRRLCNGQITCTYQSTALIIPKALQCNVAASECATCTDVNNAYSNFQIEFPGIVPTYTSTDSVQIKRNGLFENYMNNQLGLAKSGFEYLQFLDKCNGKYFGNTCDTLSSLYTKYMTSIKTGTIITDLDIRRVMSPPVVQHLTDLTRTVDTGVLHYPDSVRFWPSIYYNHFSIGVANGKSFCTSSGFETEFKFKFSFNDFSTTEIMYMNLGLDSGMVLRRYGTGLTLVLGGGSTWPAYGSYTLDVNPNAYLNWMTFRLKRYPGGYQLYFNNNLVVSQTGSGSINNYTGFSISYFKSLQFTLDWVKVRDNSGNIKYFEDYNNPYKPAVADSSFICPSTSGCLNGFVSYFNQQRGTNYSFSQIDSLYYNKCGIHPTPCDSLLPNSLFTLCNAAATYQTKDIDDLTACSDSTLFSVGVGTKIYNAYKDSLIGSFTDRYLDKCLKTRYSESFTVTAPTSEFHYTLYYYDQAGNLVKTIPPEGVDVSKFGDVTFYNNVKSARASNTLLTPSHVLATQYRYNTLNQVITQYTPDAGISSFYYDKLGRLVLSQNAKQKAPSATNDSLGLYSYTVYDVFGRIGEVGQIRNRNSQVISNSYIRFNYGSWYSATSTTRHQITRTTYDTKYVGFAGIESTTMWQKNLRNRVSYVTYADTVTNSPSSGTYYSYDIVGNVDTLLQDFGTVSSSSNYQMAIHSNRFKRMVYRYDLISGKVNHVAYQPPRGTTYYADMLYHRYSYDAENRLTLVETSADSVIWEKDARYNYYLHGPLGRIVLGDQLVQGIDYAYTLQGWLKGVNAINISTPDYDMGSDGKVGTSNQYTAKDAFGFNLNYFTGDTAIITRGKVPFPSPSGFIGAANYRPLYNGNINSMAVNINYPNGGSAPLLPQLYNYTYDQLNRITAMDVFRCSGLPTNNNWYGMVNVGDYKERVSYDANGNILKYLRQGYGANLAMDSLTYNYTYSSGRLVNNKLNYVRDQIGGTTTHSSNYTDDIDDQAAGNYTYDQIGNLIGDVKEGITNVQWNVYGKIVKITRTATASNNVTSIAYTYDPAGNRITKTVKKSATDSVEYTAYVRDASGNVMATYFVKDAPNGSINSTASLLLTEQHLYGSSRIGILNRLTVLTAGITNPTIVNFTRGKKIFELSNHLGNVLVTISDKKYGHDAGNGTIDYYTPDIITANDYYPFGMLMPGRKYTAGSSYRYGFNGKENDNDVKNVEGGQQDYGMRIYDPRVGKFLSMDPLFKSFVDLTPYQFASNTPIRATDLDGLEADFRNRRTGVHVTGPLYADNFPASEWEALGAVIYRPIVTIPNFKGTLFVPQKEQEILMSNGLGTTYIGPKSVVEANVAASRQAYDDAVAANIAGGPGGAFGYMLGGANGSFYGAAVDGVFMSFGIPGETNMSPKPNGVQTSYLETPLETRAKEILAVNNVGKRQGKTVISTAIGTTNSGKRVTLIGSSEGNLRPEQNKMLLPNEIPVNGKGHAEVNILNYADAKGITIHKIAAAGSGVCENCAPTLILKGIVVESPIRRAAPDASYVKPPLQLKLNFNAGKKGG